MNKKLLFLCIIAFGICSLSFVGLVYAAFLDKIKVPGATFKVNSAEIKFLKTLTGGINTENLTDELVGPTFDNIGQTWQQEYLLKIYNNTAATLNLNSKSNYTTANDPDDLRSYIYIEPFEWSDANNNGIAETSEIGSTYGKKTLLKWKTEGITLNTIAPGTTKALVLRFSTENLPDSKQGKTGIFDYEFESYTVN